MTALVLGANGQLAQKVREAITDGVFWSRAHADLRNTESLSQSIEALAPSVTINAAAYTAVDRAEAEPQTAWEVNVEGPACLARTASRLRIPLLHVSTDYVFDGSKPAPYEVSDPVCPINIYGATKLAGELAVRSLCKKHWILRTSWIFSENGVNFLRTILRLAAERDELRVVNDQRGRPTYAGDLATVIAAIVTAKSGARLPYGTYHAVGGSAVSWFEFARLIVDRAKAHGALDRSPQVHPVASADFPAPARRPANSVLAPSAEISALVPDAFDWKAGVERSLSQIAQRSR